MTVDTSDMLKSIFDTFSGLDYIRPEDIPNIDLYMDQVTTFMEEHLKKTRRYPEDKILTKTMINNYAKNDLLPPPTKKKYSREHMLVLTFIYIEEFYKEVFSLKRTSSEAPEGYRRKSAISKETFKDAPEEDREFLQLFLLHLSSRFRHLYEKNAHREAHRLSRFLKPFPPDRIC